MTRKQALLATIGIITKQCPENNIEIIEVLNSIIDDLPLNMWSEAAIYDSIAQFYCDHGRYPRVNDWKSRRLPTHPSIKLRTGLTLVEYMDKYFPDARVTTSTMKQVDVDSMVAQFKSEFDRIKPASSDDYNVQRASGVPDWRTLAKALELTKWSELLDATELSTKRQYIPTVRIQNGIEDMMKKIEELEAKSDMLR